MDIGKGGLSGWLGLPPATELLHARNRKPLLATGVSMKERWPWLDGMETLGDTNCSVSPFSWLVASDLHKSFDSDVATRATVRA